MLVHQSHIHHIIPSRHQIINNHFPKKDLRMDKILKQVVMILFAKVDLVSIKCLVSQKHPSLVQILQWPIISKRFHQSQLTFIG
jgi:hypothetical protein